MCVLLMYMPSPVMGIYGDSIQIRTAIYCYVVHFSDQNTNGIFFQNVNAFPVYILTTAVNI